MYLQEGVFPNMYYRVLFIIICFPGEHFISQKDARHDFVPRLSGPFSLS